MIRRVFLSLFVIAAVGDFFAVPMARATDVFWDGGAGTTVWATNNNWNPNFFPEAQFSERAVLGTDDPAPGQLSANAVIAVTPATVGGIALGLRERSSGVLVNPAPAAGALLGTLTISAGNVDSRTTGQASTGADGRVLVGVEGRGYLTMTGGRLRATQLRVAGEQVTTGAGLSTVDLSGNAEINISNAQNILAQQANDAAVNTATFSRNLRVTGPNVIFNSFGRLTLESTNALTANITSATLHSPLRTSNIAVVSGSLAVNFSGAGASGHAFGETWDLVDSPLAIAGTFSNLNTNDEVAVTGLIAPNPIGTGYRVVNESDGSGETLRLKYDRYLVLRVNRDTGELTVRNPHGGPIQIDGYTVGSSLGSMLTSYSGISGQGSPPDTGWFKPVDGSSQPLNTANTLTEIKSAIFSPPSNPTFNVTSIPSFTIGNGFSKTAVGGNVANFGTDGEDLTFNYSTPGGVIQGHVEYIGTKFENNMVLLVDPDNGQAFLKNDSLETLAFDGYTISSSTASLDGSGWTGLSAGAGWAKSLPTTTTSLSQTNATGSSTLAPGAQLALGDIGTFSSASAQAGLSLKFILSEGLEGAGSIDGDFDTDGDVDGRDFLVWQRGGSPSPFGATDLANWQANYGMSGGGAAPPETSFRIGSVVFDSAASLAAIAAVPEPTTGLMMLCVVVGVALLGRQRENRLCEQAVCIEPVRELGYQRGERNMSKRFGWCVMAVAVMFAVLFVAESASAVTQGIPLTNNRFELPGPAGSKVVAFGETGIPFAPTDPVVTLSSGVLAGGIPGWTFTGGAGGVGEACPGPGLGCETFGDLLPGDSGTEGKGLLPGNEMILSTNDGKAYQTSATSLSASPLPATQKLLLTFDVHNIFTPVGQGQLTAWIHYVDGGGTRQVLGSPVVTSPLGGFQTVTLEFVGGNAALTPAQGRPLGVSFDTTSREFDVTAVQSWAGIDNVTLEIAGTLAGDFNGDGSVTLADYTILNNNLEEAHDFLFEGDIVRDGFVDLNDFRAWKSLPPVISSGVLAQIAAIPEPSSAILILGGVAMFGAFSRRRLGISSRLDALLLAVVGAIALGASTTPVSAAELYYDPFLTGSNPAAGEYAVGTLGTTVGPGQNPTVGSFFTGPWQISATDATLGGTSAQATGLSFLGAPAAGGSLVANGSSRAFRVLTTPFSATTVGTYYISFLANYGGVGVDPNSTDSNAVGHRVIEMQLGGNEGGNYRVGYTTYNGAFGGRTPSQAPLNGGPFGQELILDGGPASFIADNGSTHLIVFKLTLSDQAASDTVEIFLNPTENDEPIIASAAFFNRDIVMDRISGPVQFGGAGTAVQFDELRIADTFIDALPEFPMKGDTNNDDLVDITDYQAIITHINLTGQSTFNGDVTGDGRVDLFDLRLWRDNRTDIPPLEAVGSVTVPEPSSVLLALLASLGLFGVRRR